MYMVHQLPASHNQHLCFLKANTQTKEKKKHILKKKYYPSFRWRYKSKPWIPIKLENGFKKIVICNNRFSWRRWAISQKLLCRLYRNKISRYNHETCIPFVLEQEQYRKRKCLSKPIIYRCITDVITRDMLVYVSHIFMI